uniref:Uncharacterized protein n=1 Tax=Steinernema glaseri TaxID=37863 RepID=A0A1I8A8S8_9BILA
MLRTVRILVNLEIVDLSNCFISSLSRSPSERSYPEDLSNLSRPTSSTEVSSMSCPKTKPHGHLFYLHPVLSRSNRRLWDTHLSKDRMNGTATHKQSRDSLASKETSEVTSPPRVFPSSGL